MINNIDLNINTKPMLSPVLLQELIQNLCAINSNDLFYGQLTHVASILATRNANVADIVKKESLRIITSWRNDHCGAKIEYCTVGVPFTDAVVENTPIGLAIFRSNGVFEEVNRAFCKMLGYTRDELLMLSTLDVTYHDDKEKCSCLLNSAYRGNTDRYRYNNRFVRKDGIVIYVEVVNSIMHNALGLPKMIVAQVKNITPQIIAEKRIRAPHEHLTHTDGLNVIGEMATEIAHEINQPLTAISLFAQTGKILNNRGQYDKLEEIFDSLVQHVRRGGAVIERIQSGTGQQKSKRVMASCHELIADVIKLAESEALILNIALIQETEESLPPVFVNKVQIQQVTLNLLRNAMEAMHSVNCRWGNALIIKTRLLDKRNIEVAIIDSGCGVSLKLEENLFTPFTSTKQLGMGLGLSISRSIITAHDRGLDFYNNASNGATFFFILPVNRNRENHA